MNELALFAGAGGGILGGALMGWRCVCAVEINAFCARRLMQRQNEGHLPPFPIWDDVSTFDGRPWRGIVDVVSGGFPCQGISLAGKGAGLDDERSGLWREFARVVFEVGPSFVFVENSPALTIRGLGRVLGDLAAMGYDARWGVFSAADAIWADGTPCLDHLRERIWIAASRYGRGCASQQRSVGKRTRKSGESNEDAVGVGRGENGARESPASDPITDTICGRCDQPEAGEDKQPGRAETKRASEATSDGQNSERERRRNRTGRRNESESDDDGGGEKSTHWWKSEPDVGRVAHGVASRMDRLRAIGNGQVPQVARLAWETLTHDFDS